MKRSPESRITKTRQWACLALTATMTVGGGMGTCPAAEDAGPTLRWNGLDMYNCAAHDADGDGAEEVFTFTTPKPYQLERVGKREYPTDAARALDVGVAAFRGDGSCARNGANTTPPSMTWSARGAARRKGRWPSAAAVFTVDIPCHEPGVRIVTQIATDNFSGGKEAGQAMIEAMGEAGGKVAVLCFKQGESALLRVKGFREVIAAHNAGGGVKIQIVSELECGGAKDVGYKAAEDVLQAHPDLRGLFAINDRAALGTRAAIEKAGKTQQVMIVGFDGQPEGRQAIKEGKIYADPIQFPDKMGVLIVEAIVRHSKGEALPPQMLIPTRLYRRADGEKDPELK